MIDVVVDPVVGNKKCLYMPRGALDRIRMSASALINETDRVIRCWYVAMIDVTPVYVIAHKVFYKFLLETTPKKSASRHHRFARQHRNPFTTVGVIQLLVPKKNVRFVDWLGGREMEAWQTSLFPCMDRSATVETYERLSRTKAHHS
jgi:hypothetical protein